MSNNKTVTVFAASCPGRLTLGEVTVDTPCGQAWMGSTTVLDDL